VGAGMANTGSVRGSTGIPEQAKWEARVSGVVDYGCGEQPGSRFGPTNIRPVRMEHAQGDGRQQRRAEPSGRSVASGRIADRLAHTDRSGSQQGGASTSTAGHGDSALSDGCAHGMADANSQTCSGRGVQGSGESVGASSGAACERPAGLCEDSRPSPLHGLWENADWLHCRDGKWRPVESGTFPLAHGVSARVVRLRGYGNAIVPQVAAGFIQAYVKAVDLGQVNQ
jgi:DNA (cytosine-5)-methyltransferase 1